MSNSEEAKSSDFIGSIGQLAHQYAPDVKSHRTFIHDVFTLCGRIEEQLLKNNSIFKNSLSNLNSTAVFVNGENIELPINFEVFLPMHLPLPVEMEFDEEKRTVTLHNTNIAHPFNYNKLINSKCINNLLKTELLRIVQQIGSVEMGAGTIYELSYDSLCMSRCPFVHQIKAFKKSNVEEHPCGIRFDFVVALEFEGSKMPLPSYYYVPPTSDGLSYKWYAYSLVGLQEGFRAAAWAVLVPKWHSVDIGQRIRAASAIQLLYRLLWSRECYLFANAFSVKFGFTMTTEGAGEAYPLMSTSELLITTLGHQIFRNFSHINRMQSNQRNLVLNEQSTEKLCEQQQRAKDMYDMLSKGFHLNFIARACMKLYSQMMLRMKEDGKAEASGSGADTETAVLDSNVEATEAATEPVTVPAQWLN
ncbi:uncharacterized protein LOC115622975 [Scaptodrosophila lebanonensis]|uniref:Uncharacterized protein LOC115622975 n=1 Tax=Drosophila lebanonensis TaxID=7225 RepID=A0A6J2TDC2_DROLE|nr:uncharacterized protein LOC115622975 [Scaptodrosophila lebanonensis]